MISIDIDSALSGAAAVFALACLAVTLRLNRSVTHWRERCAYLEASLPGLHREIERFACLTARTEREVKRMENDYAHVAERLELAQARGPAQALDQAIDSARRGADPRRLTLQFGLSRGEAELVERLHGRKRSA